MKVTGELLLKSVIVAEQISALRKSSVKHKNKKSIALVTIDNICIFYVLVIRKTSVYLRCFC